jgi:hypothetical protein
MKLGDFLNTLARKCNIENDPHLVSFLSNAENANREIADEFVNSIDTNLMSLEGAKNNPAVLNHYKPIILKAVDDKFAVIAEKYGFSEDLLNEKSSYKKFDILESRIEKKIAEIEAKQGKTGDKEKEAKLTEQLNELTGKLQQITQQKETELKAVETRYEGEITEMHVKNLLASKKYATKDLPSDVNISVARHLLDSQLKAQGAMLVRKDGELRLVQAANPDMDFVDTGFKKVSFADFTNKVLAENKLLDVSTGEPAKPAQQHQQQPIIPTQPNVNTSKFDAAAQRAMESIATTE